MFEKDNTRWVVSDTRRLEALIAKMHTGELIMNAGLIIGGALLLVGAAIGIPTYIIGHKREAEIQEKSHSGARRIW